ncbi:exonuclease SbcC [Microbacterium sp. LTA6]|uniref:putative immunity protein n=1 Tax=Microbacterium sp. LTA6 TaxID=3129771 RepID=UPI003244F0F5
MTSSSGDFELAMDEIRVVAGFAAEAAARILPIFERVHPDDARPREAVDAARAFAAGAPRTMLQRTTAFAAHRAAKESTDERAKLAAQAAGDAAAAAYLHPIAKAHQVAHILRATAIEAYLAELDDAGDEEPGALAVRRCAESASPGLIDVLRRYPPAPPGTNRVAQIMSMLDTALRNAGR